MKGRNNSIYDNGITHGSILKQLLLFFFPILLGTFFQQLYNTVDAIIVGRFLGKQALAAVGSGTATAVNLLVGFFVGLSSGATVIISQYYGAMDEINVNKSIHNACAIALWGGLGVSVIGFCYSGPLLRLIGTNPDVYPLAVGYMRIYFAGAVVVVMYNIGAAIYRAFGDSRRPLYFLIAGCFVNIGLDVLFVGTFKLGVNGAAYATVLSQFFSLVLIVVFLRRRNDCCRLEYRKVKIDSEMLKRTLYIGLPTGIQSVMYSISNLIIQSRVNSFGTDTEAAWAAYGKLDAFYWMIINALGIALTTFIGQNYGAGLNARAKKGVREGLCVAFSMTALVEVLYLSFGRYGFMLFTSDPSVIEIGMDILNHIVPFFFTYTCIEVLSGALRGAGKTVFATAATVIGICGFRALYLFIVSRVQLTIPAVMACYPISWVIVSITLIAYYTKSKLFN